MSIDDENPGVTDIELSDDEASAVSEAALAFGAALPSDRQGPYRALAAAADEGTVPADQVADLERVCVLALETGKARQLGRAEVEQLLAAVYRRTPGGRALQADAADVNRALAQLAGRELESVRLMWNMPGRYGLSLTVQGISLLLAIEPDGLRVRTLQAG